MQPKRSDVLFFVVILFYIYFVKRIERRIHKVYYLKLNVLVDYYLYRLDYFYYQIIIGNKHFKFNRTCFETYFRPLSNEL
jgi:hypothetical protein